jgi:hypothetical protein
LDGSAPVLIAVFILRFFPPLHAAVLAKWDGGVAEMGALFCICLQLLVNQARAEEVQVSSSL